MSGPEAIAETQTEHKVAMLLSGGSNSILVVHVPEGSHGAGVAVLDALEGRDASIYDLNPSYVTNPIERIAGGEAMDAVLPVRRRGRGPAIAWVSGWGSRPTEADALLRSLASTMRLMAMLTDAPDLRIVVLNNASPIPPGWPEHGPAAWPEAESFARHVAELTGVGRSAIDVWTPNSLPRIRNAAPTPSR